jgi:signal transduction histidine kinase/CheY-like chemotaxis protein
MGEETRSGMRRYGVALAGTAVALAAYWPLKPLLGEWAPYLTFLPAVLVAGYCDGLGAALVTTALGFVSAALFLDPSGVGKQGAFVLAGILLGMVTELLLRARLQTARSLAQLHSLLSHAPIGFAFFNRDGRCVRINPHLAGLAGAPADAVGRPAAEALPGAGEQLGPVLEEVFRTGGPTPDRGLSVEGPGGPRHWLVHCYPVRPAPGGPVLWAGVVVVDLTERERLEADLRRQAEQLAEQDRRKDALLAMLGHELRNPLAPVRSTANALRLRFPDDPEVAEMADLVDRQVRHLGRLLDDLLDASRISRGLIKLRKEPVELAPVARRAVEGVRPLLVERGHRWTVALPPTPVWLDADPARLEQVIASLVDNAARYTEPGGLISLAAEPAGGEVVVRVRDNGIGIRPEMLPKLFDLFTQGDRVPGWMPEGLGVGLTLVRDLVKLHGGSVRAHSAGPGQGSTFEVRLPVRPAPPPAPAGQLPGVRKKGAPLRVLVVDDNADAAHALALLLRMQGHEVRVTYDGPSTLAVAPEQRPDVIFLDIGLPGGLDGYEVARRLRAEPGFAGLRLVALTGYGQDQDRQRSAEAGFDAHLVKPVGVEELREVLAPPQPVG